MKLQKMLAAVMATSMVFTAVPVMNGVSASAASTDAEIALNTGWCSIHSVKYPDKDVTNKGRSTFDNMLNNDTSNAGGYACAADDASKGENTEPWVTGQGDSIYFQVDLQDEYQLSKVKMWRYQDSRIYLDTIVVASEDENFDETDTVLWNAADEAHAEKCGFSSTAGRNELYVENSVDGKEFPTNAKARYIRIYMAGSKANENATSRHGGCHINELKIFGAKVHTVTFDDKVDGTANTTVEVLSGDKLTMPKPPTREGYTFTGWYTDAECTAQYDNDAKTWANSDAAAVTLYAGWEKNLTGITLEADLTDHIYNLDTTNGTVLPIATGVTVTANYRNVEETTKNVTNDAEVTVDELDVSTTGKKKVTVTAVYDGERATKDVNVKVIDGEAKAALDAAIAEANVVNTEAANYSATSVATFEAAKEAAVTLRENLVNVENEAVNDTDNVAGKLTDAIDGLEELYKVTVPTGVTIKAENGATVTTGTAGSWVYVPVLTKVTVTADRESNGKKFAAWMWDGQKLSETNEYAFYAVGNMEVTPTYNKEEIREKNVEFACSTKYANNRRCFIAKRSVSKAYKVKEYGVVITDQKGWTDHYASDQNSFVKGAARTKCTYRSADVNPNNGTFEARLKCGRTEKWYGRAYVTYEAKDGTGEPVTVYSNVIQY